MKVESGNSRIPGLNFQFSNLYFRFHDLMAYRLNLYPLPSQPSFIQSSSKLTDHSPVGNTSYFSTFCHIPVTLGTWFSCFFTSAKIYTTIFIHLHPAALFPDTAKNLTEHSLVGHTAYFSSFCHIPVTILSPFRCFFSPVTDHTYYAYTLYNCRSIRQLPILSFTLLFVTFLSLFPYRLV